YSANNQPMIRLMVSPNPLSIKDINNVASFNLNAYPNPAQNETTIEYTLTSNSNVVITVSDIMGREIVRMNEGTKTANSINRVALNTANMNNGTYFYTINVNGVKETKKLVVNK
ncbi:MAG: T9SS type A sorting domain-containing protein, partial [Bacteroidales bacterium]|nr:T9SS type A sorting domain-containing protein [Bacteroidales bacterium]